MIYSGFLVCLFGAHDTSDEQLCIMATVKLSCFFNVGNVKPFGRWKGWMARMTVCYAKVFFDGHNDSSQLYVGLLYQES